MLAQLEDATVIDALSLEYAAGIMQPVAKHMEIDVAPVLERAVKPDLSVLIVEIHHDIILFICLRRT
jgi:hypothetical protein